MSILAIGRTAALRIVRDRTALFFMIILPIVVIVVVGAVVSGVDRIRVGIVVEDHGPLSSALVAQLRANRSLSVRDYADTGVGRTAVRRSEIAALIEIPAGIDASLRRGDTAQIPVYANDVSENAQAVDAAIQSTVGAHAALVQAARFAARQGGGGFDANLARARRARDGIPAVVARDTVVDTKSKFLPSGFNYSAPTMLVLFVFINSLAAGAAMIETRRLGMYERIIAAPVKAGSIVLGEMLVYVAIALTQSALIIGVGALLFGVHWGNPLAAAALTFTWALVGAGAGMLAGTLFRTPEQSNSVAIAAGLILGMLGGCMWPLEIVPAGMRAFGHLTPHAWAVDAWTELLSRAGTLSDITRQLLVLLGFAFVLVAVSARRLRHTLVA